MPSQSEQSNPVPHSVPQSVLCPVPRPAGAVHHFMISAAADASTLARVVELFALRGLVPDEVSCKRTDDDGYHIHIAIPDLAEAKAANLAARMRNIVPVMGVVLEPAPHA
ncbi:MAG: hypothetical protein VCE74_05740 [Alphaproteobacteria bacterium]|jgi:hypothetical protein